MCNLNLKLCTTVLDEHEPQVLSNLAVTPADMENMTVQGKAIASAQLEPYAYYPPLTAADGLPLDFRRGVDINTAWEASQDAKSKVRAAAKLMKKGVE